jgi:hypothetical protein
MITENKQPLLEQIVEFFPSYYTTLISVIQATALGYLLVVVSGFVKGCPALEVSQIILAIMTFGVLIEVWYEYMMGSTVFRWVPIIWDSVIPFLIGVAEFLLILSISPVNIALWYFSLSITCLVSFVAFKNMYRGTRKLRHDSNILALRLLGAFPKINEFWILSYALIFSIFSLLEYKYKLDSSALQMISLILLTAFIYRGHCYWKRLVA